MAKYLILMGAMGGMLMLVEAAEARGHRRGGCPGGNCYVGGGCPGGVCGVPTYAEPYAIEGDAPAPMTAAPVTRNRAPVRYTNYARRGWFGWRRS